MTIEATVIRASGKRKWLVAGSILLLGILAYEVYRAFYPGEAFYQAAFEEVAEVGFPDSGRFIFKTASFPDIHGDFGACGIFTVAAADFAFLASHIRTQPFQGTARLWYSECEGYLADVLGEQPVFLARARREELGEIWYWGLLDDGRSVVFHYVSW